MRKIDKREKKYRMGGYEKRSMRELERATKRIAAKWASITTRRSVKGDNDAVLLTPRSKKGGQGCQFIFGSLKNPRR